jgi:hypothetical protein
MIGVGASMVGKIVGEANAVSAPDEFTNRRRPLPEIGFHDLMCKPGNLPDAMGYSPHINFRTGYATMHP